MVVDLLPLALTVRDGGSGVAEPDSGAVEVSTTFTFA